MTKKYPYNYTNINGTKTFGEMLQELGQSLLPHADNSLNEPVLAYRIARGQFYTITKAWSICATPLTK